jgi:hypothetical protein
MSPICGELKLATPTVQERVEGDDTLLKHDFVRNCTEACSFGG